MLDQDAQKNFCDLKLSGLLKSVGRTENSNRLVSAPFSLSVSVARELSAINHWFVASGYKIFHQVTKLQAKPPRSISMQNSTDKYNCKYKYKNSTDKYELQIQTQM